MSIAKFGSSVIAVSIGALALTVAGPARAGGLILYEVGTADVALASAGYSARAQDASTVLSNPAGMTLLDGKQVLLGTQMLYTDPSFSVDSGFSRKSRAPSRVACTAVSMVPCPLISQKALPYRVRKNGSSCVDPAGDTSRSFALSLSCGRTPWNRPPRKE